MDENSTQRLKKFGNELGVTETTVFKQKKQPAAIASNKRKVIFLRADTSCQGQTVAA